ncbi:MAG: matrixin family metalloprotease [Thaumarchaeota archaeon]|nr:matrixin family metalloprotease [Nitrososphaerota archaeon]
MRALHWPVFLILILGIALNHVSAQQSVNTTMTNLPLDMKKDATLKVSIKADPSIPYQKVASIKDAILSTNKFTKDGKVYYQGWQDALFEASQHHAKLPIPTKFQIVDSLGDQNGLTINLSSAKENNGYAGWTTFEINDQYLTNVAIVIFDVNDLDDDQLKALIRHELGHGLGLGHSDDPDDLMYDTVNTIHSSISECDIGALADLYDGKEQSQVTCAR